MISWPLWFRLRMWRTSVEFWAWQRPRTLRARLIALMVDVDRPGAR